MNNTIQTTVKFKSVDSNHQLFWKTLRQNVNEYFDSNQLSPKANLQMVIKTITILGFYIIPFILLLTLASNGLFGFGMVVLMGLAKAGIGMSIMHDGLHGAYSAKKWANKLTGFSMYLIGSNVFNWKIQHNIYHHAYTNIEGLDEDIQTRWIIRLSEHSDLKPIHRFQHLYSFFLYGLMTFSMLFGDIKQLIQYQQVGIIAKHNADYKKEMFLMLFVKTVYLFTMIGLPALLTNYAWWQITIGFFIMHWIAGFVLSLVFQMAHIVEDAHQPVVGANGITPNDWAVHQLLTTANFAPKHHLLNWYVGGLNFQVEHHLFPNICHVHYANISPIVAQTAAQFGIPYNSKPTLKAAVVSHYQRLKELGR